MIHKKAESHSATNANLQSISPYFLGSYGENSDVLEKLLLDFLRDHIFWRRNYHQEDTWPISTQTMHTAEFNDAIAHIREELQSLTTKLKRTVPIFNPRYLGHMASDLMLPGLLAQLVTTLYNPNNSSLETGKVTIEMELAVGKQFAEMFGYNTNNNSYPCAWGHLTSGGTDANYESLWNFRAVKYYPVALIEALKRMSLEIKFDDPATKNPFDYSPWELINLSVDDVLALRRRIFARIRTKLGAKDLQTYSRLVEDNRLETLGPAQFFAEHWKSHQPVVLVPATAYTFWKKAMRMLGFGCASLIEVPLTSSMRMDTVELERILKRLQSQHIPVLTVIGVLGTINFGAIDPVHAIIELQKTFAAQKFNFYVHIDASHGGYLNTLFRDKSGQFISHEKISAQFNHFPSAQVYQAFNALPKADSITVAPHTSGFLPRGVGGFIARNREIVKLLNHSEHNLLNNDDNLDLIQLSEFVLSGAKPGAIAAAAYVTHKVLPLNDSGFGRVMGQSIYAAEYFVNQINSLKAKLKGIAHACIPFDTDTNFIVIAINPHGNRSLLAMNEFMGRVYKKITLNPLQALQSKDFLGSMGELPLHNLSEPERRSLFKRLHLDTTHLEKYAESTLCLLHHSLLNPWVSSSQNDINYLDAYCQFLAQSIQELVKNDG